MSEKMDALKAERSWRCFHCDEVFYTMDAARAHFGSSEIDETACKVDGGLAAAFRDLESRWRQCLHEDCPAMRGAYSCDADHRQAIKREEEVGFERGMKARDAEIIALHAQIVMQREGWLHEARIYKEDLKKADDDALALTARLAEVLRERDEARAALKPFAEYPIADSERNETYQLTGRKNPATGNFIAITSGDMRRARAILSEIQSATAEQPKAEVGK